MSLAESQSSKDEATELPKPAQLVALRREALLPMERRGAAAGVTAACMMAGVASGLALATTLLAMQVADGIAAQQSATGYACGAREHVARRPHGYLGMRYVATDAGARVESVFANTPAAELGLRAGDIVESIDGIGLTHGQGRTLASMVYGRLPGAEIQLVIRRGDLRYVAHPELAAWPPNMSAPALPSY